MKKILLIIGLMALSCGDEEGSVFAPMLESSPSPAPCTVNECAWIDPEGSCLNKYDACKAACEPQTLKKFTPGTDECLCDTH